MSGYDAHVLAEQKDLDLVKISPNVIPPVCKIMDYGKFCFEQSKKEREARKRQKTTEMKEIWLSMTIEAHDLAVKAKQAIKFAKDGDKIKVSIKMKGRQNAHSSFGVAVMERFHELLKDCTVIEKRPLTEGRNIIMILSPVKTVTAPSGATAGANAGAPAVDALTQDGQAAPKTIRTQAKPPSGQTAQATQPATQTAKKTDTQTATQTDTQTTQATRSPASPPTVKKTK
jgi:translation initiation factor IF-3